MGRHYGKEPWWSYHSLQLLSTARHSLNRLPFFIHPSFPVHIMAVYVGKDGPWLSLEHLFSGFGEQPTQEHSTGQAEVLQPERTQAHACPSASTNIRLRHLAPVRHLSRLLSMPRTPQHLSHSAHVPYSAHDIFSGPAGLVLFWNPFALACISCAAVSFMDTPSPPPGFMYTLDLLPGSFRIIEAVPISPP